jgi:hypothetical protein
MVGVNLAIISGFYTMAKLDWMLAIDISNVIVVLIFLVTVWFAARKELPVLAVLALLLSPVSLAYVSYKCYVFFSIPPIGFFMPIFYALSKSKNSLTFLTHTVGFYAISHLLVVAWLVFVWRNFGQGLEDVFAREHAAENPMLDRLIDTGVI